MIGIGFLMSPIGILRIEGDSKYITSIKCSSESSDEILTPAIEGCKKELIEYFNREREEFSVKTKFLIGTEFQQRVWNELKKIAYGETVSYKYIAKQIDNEKAVRAVGGANNKNPIMIIVPCHRVIGANGKMVGYAGGIEKKEYLINLEKK